MRLPPIKNDDPKLDFYTMYARETLEYDNEYMKKHNEDIQTTLIFVCSFFPLIVMDADRDPRPVCSPPSAPPSSSIPSPSSNLAHQNDRSCTSEQFSSTSIDPFPPTRMPAALRRGAAPPQEIVTSLVLLYASLLMSLLAAFVAMMDKWWVNRYLRHVGGSMIERCGDRQRKFDGLEKWRFPLPIEALPIMLQLAVFSLACGVSRYLWSINAFVAWIVISFTLVGFLFYIGIVIAGTWSYDCPFQTPVSIALRHPKVGRAIWRLLSTLTPSNAVSFIRLVRKKTRRLLVILSSSSAASLIYTTRMDFYQGLVSSSRRAYSIMRHPLTPERSPRQILSGILYVVRNPGDWAIVLFLHACNKFENTCKKFKNMCKKFEEGKQWMVQRFMPTGPLLAIFTQDVNPELVALPTSEGLRVPVRNLETIRKQNADNAGCVCWVLRNITDPEALDAAIRLAGTIRWFDGDWKHNPPLDVIVSTFEACFDLAKRLYPGMGDRAYFSARAILQISLRERFRSHERASKYPIPTQFRHPIQFILPTLFRSTDLDLGQVVKMLQCNARAPTLTLPLQESGDTRGHSLWLSNLLVDFAHARPDSDLLHQQIDFAAAETKHQPMIANVLVMWYLLLGGHVEEETLWAIDKSCAVVSLFLPPEYLTPYAVIHWKESYAACL